MIPGFPPSIPKGVHFKHGSYYLVLHNKWHRLGKTITPAALVQIDRLRSLGGRRVGEIGRLADHLSAKLPSVRRNAKARGLVFSLSAEEVLAQADRQEWRCAITGLSFSLDPHPGLRYPPYAPSIDRIDSLKGYESGNYRIVFNAANMARGNLPDDVFRRIVTFAGARLLDTQPID